MTHGERFDVVYSYKAQLKKIISRSLFRCKFKEDILQDFFLKIFNSANLPDDKIEILRFCITSLKNLIIDIKRSGKYTLLEETNKTNLDCTDNTALLENIRVEYTNITTDNHFEIFTDLLDDCLLDSYKSLSLLDQKIMINFFLLGFTMREIGIDLRIPMHFIKGSIYKFRQKCGINVNINSDLF